MSATLEQVVAEIVGLLPSDTCSLFSPVCKNGPCEMCGGSSVAHAARRWADAIEAHLARERALLDGLAKLEREWRLAASIDEVNARRADDERRKEDSLRYGKKSMTARRVVDNLAALRRTFIGEEPK